LGTATELRAQRNYAGHRLSPWLGHVMVSKQETARALLTPGEVMQLPATDELVLVSGLAPIRAKKLRYYADRNFTSRIEPAPILADGAYRDCPASRTDDWSGRTRGLHNRLLEAAERETTSGASDEGGLQQQRVPELGDNALAALLGDQPLGPVRDEDEAFSETAIPDRAGLDGLGRARAMNDGDRHLGNDVLPAF
jgi:type IV secretion system protein VirD4